jgi:hypothetical protein
VSGHLAGLARKARCTRLQQWTLEQLAAGRTVEQIAAERGVCTRAVAQVELRAKRRIAAHYGFTIPDNRDARRRRREHIIRLLEERHTDGYVARAFSVSQQYVMKVRHRYTDLDGNAWRDWEWLRKERRRSLRQEQERS